MAAAPSAIVLGGGIAGLGAAIGLRRAGYAVSVHEQAERIEPLGAAISLWPNAVAALRELDALGPIAAQAAPIRTVMLATHDGRPLMGPWPIDAARHGEPAYLPTRALVQRTLQDALGDVPLRLGRRAMAVVDGPAAARVTFVDGEQAAADIVVVADGIRSAAGIAVAGNPPHPCGYGGVLALSDAVAGQAPDGMAVEYWGRGERFGVFDLGGGRCYWFYMQSGREQAPTREVLLGKAANWPEPVGVAIAATPADRLIPVAIHARSVPRRLAAGRVIAVGDAAHAMEPNLGQGACQALEDAVVLGRLAGRLEPAALGAAFDRARRRRVAGIMRRAKEGGRAVHGSAFEQFLWPALFRLTPAALQRRFVESLYRLPA